MGNVCLRRIVVDRGEWNKLQAEAHVGPQKRSLQGKQVPLDVRLPVVVNGRIWSLTPDS
jgi:hypothetical protein